MRCLPKDLSDLFSPQGHRLVAGRHPLCGALREPGRQFVAAAGLFDRAQLERCRTLLDRRLLSALRWMEDPIPASTIEDMVRNYSELLPKTVRVRTALLESRRAKAYRVAQELGLTALLRSEGMRTLAQALAGRPLHKSPGIQALCYGPGDYAGPHNDHHPEEPQARHGYLDVHLTLCSPAVAQQLLVYERGGHLSEVASVATSGTVTAYHLPFWHYTTPLVARPGAEADARRWVLLGTFLFDRSAAQGSGAQSASSSSSTASNGSARTRSVPS